MKHEEYRELLELAALDTLGESDLRALEKHLATCDECRAELEELRAAAAMLTFHVEAVTPSVELTARILEITRTPRMQRTPGHSVIGNRHQSESAEDEQ